MVLDRSLREIEVLGDLAIGGAPGNTRAVYTDKSIGAGRLTKSSSTKPVILSAAKDLRVPSQRSFAALRMTPDGQRLCPCTGKFYAITQSLN